MNRMRFSKIPSRIGCSHFLTIFLRLDGTHLLESLLVFSHKVVLWVTMLIFCITLTCVMHKCHASGLQMTLDQTLVDLVLYLIKNNDNLSRIIMILAT